MSSQLIYMPVFRLRQEEKKVLVSRSFGDHIYPCVEILKERERNPIEGTPVKSFEQSYLPTLARIKSRHVFVDLPVYFEPSNKTVTEIVRFVRGTIDERERRTAYMLKFAPLAEKVIPVISTYFLKTNERGSIKLQEHDLRKKFNRIAFRLFPDTIVNDLEQIKEVVQAYDFLIVDLQDNMADPQDRAIIKPLLKALDGFNGCPKILLRDVVNCTIKNIDLEHGAVITEIHNGLISNYRKLGFDAFGDYAGIKKDDITDGGGISPGFIFYDPVNNNYSGYKGGRYKNWKGKMVGNLGDFQKIIVPAVMRSIAVNDMRASGMPFLSSENMGWTMLNLVSSGDHSGRSQANFKRISMEHYVHCIQTRIDDLDI